MFKLAHICNQCLLLRPGLLPIRQRWKLRTPALTRLEKSSQQTWRFHSLPRAACRVHRENDGNLVRIPN